VEKYKYLGIVFHNRFNWETCRAKRIQGMESPLPSAEQMQESRIMELEDQENSFWVVGYIGCTLWM